MHKVTVKNEMFSTNMFDGIHLQRRRMEKEDCSKKSRFSGRYGHMEEHQAKLGP